MDLRPPPRMADKDLDIWLQDLYRFLGKPVFPGSAVSPRINYGEDAESTDTYVVSIDGITSYTSGTVIMFKATTINTGACTINVNSLGAKSLKINGDTTDPADGWIKSGSIVLAVYDGTNFQIINPDMTP